MKLQKYSLNEQKNKQAKRRKIHIGFYPYTYVRTIVMKTFLLKKEDYHKIMKMPLNEIARFLQDGSYREEIDSLASQYHGAEMIEMAINKNLVKSFNKLKRISPEELNLLINAYLKREDIWNIKTIIRGKYTNENEIKVEKMLLPVGALDINYLTALIQKKTIEEVLKSLKIINFDDIKTAYDSFKNNSNLIELENALDHIYYSGLASFIKRIPKQKTILREFFESEIEALNILTVLRLKKEGMGKEEIKKYLFSLDIGKNKRQFTENMLDMKDLKEVFDFLLKTKYRNVIESSRNDFEEKGTLIPLEVNMYIYLLKKFTSFQHQHMLSVDAILSYMFSKELEIRNLRTIVKGKELKLSNEAIERYVVV